MSEIKLTDSEKAVLAFEILKDLGDGPNLSNAKLKKQARDYLESIYKEEGK